MNVTLFLYLAFGIAVPALILIELARHRMRAVHQEIVIPLRVAILEADKTRRELLFLALKQANLDFIPFRCPPWRWFRYRNLLQGQPTPSERPYHQDQSIAG